MYLVKRNNPVFDFPRFVNRYFEDSIEEDSVVWRPRVDIKESNDAYSVIADLPGLDKKDIHISLHDNVLTLKGERKSEVKKEDENTSYSERVHGSFHRELSLNSTVDQSNVKAEYKNGVLHLTLPKAEEAKPREIEIH